VKTTTGQRRLLEGRCGTYVNVEGFEYAVEPTCG
jgi:hypothetical protein